MSSPLIKPFDPNRHLVIVDGQIKLSDGTSLRTYLSRWQKAAKVKDGTPVAMLPIEALETIANDAFLGRYRGS
jgi:hypothetical protein